MFKGTVSLSAGIKGNGLQFAAFDFKPNEPGVDKVTLEGPDGHHLLSTVYFAAVATQDDGEELAAKVTAAALDRLTYHHGIAAEDTRITGHQFSPVIQPGGAHVIAMGTHLFISGTARAVLGVPPATLKLELEQSSPPGERNFSLFRSALMSPSPVEAFMHLYNLLLMLYNDSHADLDAFVVGQDPAVPQTQHPKTKAGVMETVYTRLRNEFAHIRPGVNIATTKADMANRLGGLRDLTKKAIELNP